MASSTLSPPLSSNELMANKGPSIYAAAITTFTLASIGVVLRILSRRLACGRFWWDDWFIFISYFFAIPIFAVTILWLKKGVGKHIEVVALTATGPQGVVMVLKTVVPGGISYTLSILFSKYSILAFYWRIFGLTNLRWLLIFLTIFVTCRALAVIIASSIFCIPLAALWDENMNGRCINLGNFYVGVEVPNVVTDWIMLIVPLRYVDFSSLEDFRVIFISHLDLTDVTWGLVNLVLWTCVECLSSVFCACLPSLKPIYNLLLGKSANSDSRTKPGGPYNNPLPRNHRTPWDRPNEIPLGSFSNSENLNHLRGEEDWAPVAMVYASNGHAGLAGDTDILLSQEVAGRIHVTNEVSWKESKNQN
ncbi:hypothetical protein B7494_g7999 [Chlorociboria aeruginascens]|nr:hypothetical protein B7494_g7999 [Chlorociboria aeruginascens]